MVHYTIVKVDVTATATPKKGDDFLVRGHDKPILMGVGLRPSILSRWMLYLGSADIADVTVT